MPVLDQFKHQARALLRPQRTGLAFSLPHPNGGEPLCRASVALETTQGGGGETLRLRVHVDGWLRPTTVSAKALPTASDRRGLRQTGRQLVRGAARRGLALLPLRMEGRRLRTWVDVRASTAPLAAGAEALLPTRLRSLIGDGLPRQPGAPRIGLWSDRDAHGNVAHLALLQLDQRDLPNRNHDRPFNLVASVATTLEPRGGG